MVLALAACGGPHQGTVHDKSYTPGHLYTTTICHLVGKTTICTPQTQYMGPSWELDIYNGDDHGWVSVNEGIYDSVRVGDYVDLDK